MKLTVRHNVSLAAHTTLSVGGVADYYVEVHSVDELTAALLYALLHTTTPPLILGGGSNLLIGDTGYRGLVIKNSCLGRNYQENSSEVLFHCMSGEVLDKVIEESTAKGYWGLENLSSIPGTVGATPIQNVGAYGVEVSSRIVSVTAVHSTTLKTKTFTPNECQFLYRDSYFKTDEGKKWVITEVVFSLSTVAHPELVYGDLVTLRGVPSLTPNDVRQKVQRIRAEKFPDWHVVGTAGSFFKNPVVSKEKYNKLAEQYPDMPAYALTDNSMKLSLGWILDKICDLRGYCDGKVCLYQKQALVLTNTGDSAQAVLDFKDKVMAQVYGKLGITIEPEVTIIE